MKLLRTVSAFAHPLVAVVSLCLAAQGAHAQVVNAMVCGPLKSGYGPFDYRTVSSDARHRVEDYHFTPDVEMLRKGASTAYLAGDLDYTLRALPNSPRALLAMSRESAKEKRDTPVGAHYSAECYFERAIRFVPDDPMPHVLYASFLKDRKRIDEARAQLDAAAELRGEQTNFDLDYNLGVLYFDLGQYDKSLDAAKRAYALGAPLPALMKKLKAAGKWTD
jgi:tetratricopeptide (TPR) repeat protein